MTSDDILIFIENNLDFSEENITSFNKLFKGDSSIEEILKKIGNSLSSLEISENASENDIETMFRNKIVSKEAELTKNPIDSTTALASKIYN